MKNDGEDKKSILNYQIELQNDEDSFDKYYQR